MVIFGGGYAVGLLESLAWLADLDVVYWGDIDTHGFAILDRLRRHFPRLRSVLMDRATLRRTGPSGLLRAPQRPSPWTA